MGRNMPCASISRRWRTEPLRPISSSLRRPYRRDIACSTGVGVQCATGKGHWRLRLERIPSAVRRGADVHEALDRGLNHWNHPDSRIEWNRQVLSHSVGTRTFSKCDRFSCYDRIYSNAFARSTYVCCRGESLRQCRLTAEAEGGGRPLTRGALVMRRAS